MWPSADDTAASPVPARVRQRGGPQDLPPQRSAIGAAVVERHGPATHGEARALAETPPWLLAGTSRHDRFT